MPLDEATLLDSFGTAAVSGNGALFIGAGVSQPSGFPTWPKLLEAPRTDASIPDKVSDLALVAEYYVQAFPDGRERIEAHVLDMFWSVAGKPGRAHGSIAALPVSEIWTTNYDTLLEQKMRSAVVVTREDDLVERRRSWSRRIIKIHGSLSSVRKEWLSSPIITRKDYEIYSSRHPRIWSALQAAYLTRSFLFLGFSFSDPNVDVLLRLARNSLHISAPEHFTVVRQPPDADDRKLFQHQVRDLEESGIGVLVVRDFDEHDAFLERLVRRTREPRLFVAGSDHGAVNFDQVCHALGTRLATVDLQLDSLAGPAGTGVSYAFANCLALGAYNADRVRLFFRAKADPPPGLTERIGTVFYTQDDKDTLRRRVMDQCRALLVVGGGGSTREEIEIAGELGVPVIAVPIAGGTARATWEEQKSRLSTMTLGGRVVDPDEFGLLENPDAAIAATAAVGLVKQAMYL